VLTRLEAEANELTSTGAAEAEIAAARGRLAEAEAALAVTEKAFAEAQDTRSGIEARRASLTAALRKRRRARTLQAEIEKVIRERDALLSEVPAGADLGGLQAALDAAIAAAKVRDEELALSEARHTEARATELKARGRSPKPNGRRKISKLKSPLYRNC